MTVGDYGLHQPQWEQGYAVPQLGRFPVARLFIVDDNPSNVALMVAVLTRAGYQDLFTETNSRKVRDRLVQVDPDLIILDLHMPHIDGYQVLEQIREFAPSDALPVLVLTADTTPAASERALRSGAQDFVTKPFSNGEVLVRVRNLLQARFLYTTLRMSMVRQREATANQQRLAQALNTEQQAGQRLRFLDGVKDTLLQTVSHDLRNPIWAVLMLTDLLAADAKGTQPLTAETRLSVIGKVAVSAKQMDRLLKDILDSDPMRRLEDHQGACDVGELVTRVLAEVDLGRDHPLKTNIAPVTISVDPGHLERIVSNLLNNAHQHLTAGVPIWVTVGPTPDGVLISVEDAGPGVAPEIAESIFQPFQRGATGSTSGLGLGLSLVSRFATLHGGRAWAEERVGGGASFRVFLPSQPLVAAPAMSHD